MKGEIDKCFPVFCRLFHFLRRSEVMQKSEIAAEIFIKGYNCAQSVFYAFCDELGFDKDTALKISCGFGGGMARKEEVCGAVTGGIMVIGLKYGRGENDDTSSMIKTYEMTRTLMERFAKRHGSFICRNLLNGCELGTPGGQKEYKEKELRKKICKPCVESAVQIIEEIK